jgi:hypothetical protein
MLSGILRTAFGHIYCRKCAFCLGTAIAVSLIACSSLEQVTLAKQVAAALEQEVPPPGPSVSVEQGEGSGLGPGSLQVAVVPQVE